jgi:hypothetical protein
MMGYSGPNIYPEAILKSKAYEIFPEAPVTATLLG